VILRDETLQLSCELLSERGLFLRGSEPHFGFERERRELLSRLVGPVAELRNVADGLARQREKVAR